VRLRRFLLVLLLPLIVGCIPAAGPAVTPDVPTQVPSPSLTEPSQAVEPSQSLEPSDEPLATPTPVESADPSPSESAGPDPAAACSGDDKNRAFFADAAAALTWTVYCASLPAGWFVDAGEYRKAGGGRLEISYRGPSGTRLELHEGAFCADGSGCVPSGTESGDAAFGDQTGTLVATDDGGWAVVVDEGAALSWLAVGKGLNEATFRAITDALTAVKG
jgi:hypothetical protein